MNQYYTSIKELLLTCNSQSIDLDLKQIKYYGGQSVIIKHKNYQGVMKLLKVCPLEAPEGNITVLLRIDRISSTNINLNITNLQLLHDHGEFNCTKVHHPSVAKYDAMVVQDLQDYRALIIEMPDLGMAISKYLYNGDYI